MKKTFLIVLLVSQFSGMGAGAATIQSSIDLKPFKNVNISGNFSVSLVRGTDYRALITVEDIYKDYIICKVNSNTLTIDIDERKVPSDVKKLFRGKGTPDPVFSAVVYVPELVQAVVLSDKAVLRDCDDVFDKAKAVFELGGSSTAKNLELSSQIVGIKMQNKSTADFGINCKILNVETANSANLRIDESSEEANYALQASSKVYAKSRTGNLSLKTKSNAYMSISGNGNLAVYELTGTSEVNALGFEVPDAKVTMTSVCQLSQAAYKTLSLNLNGGSTLYFTNDPQVNVENIKSSTVSRITKK